MEEQGGSLGELASISLTIFEISRHDEEKRKVYLSKTATTRPLEHWLRAKPLERQASSLLAPRIAVREMLPYSLSQTAKIHRLIDDRCYA